MCVLSASAQETNLLSLAEARALVLKQHPRITAAELIALASREVVREVRSAYYPVITANATVVGTSGSNTRIAAGALNNPLILDRNAEGIMVSQIITDFGRTANLSASSTLNAKARESALQATREQIFLQVDSAYYRGLQAQAVREVARQTVAAREFIFQYIDESARSGLKSSVDLSFAKVGFSEGKLLLASAENEVSAANAVLANLLGERRPVYYCLVDETNSVARPAEMSQLLAAALQNRPDLARMRYEKEAAFKFAQAEKKLHYPTVSAVGTAGVIPEHDALMKGDYAAAGINVSLPIFDGMLFSAREKEAEFRARAAEEGLREFENNIIQDVRIAALNLEYSAQRIELTRELVTSAREAFELAQARYKAGASSILELSQAQLSQTQAEIEQAQARYEYQTRNSILNFQLGHMP